MVALAGVRSVVAVLLGRAESDAPDDVCAYHDDEQFPASELVHGANEAEQLSPGPGSV